MPPVHRSRFGPSKVPALPCVLPPTTLDADPEEHGTLEARLSAQGQGIAGVAWRWPATPFARCHLVACAHSKKNLTITDPPPQNNICVFSSQDLNILFSICAQGACCARGHMAGPVGYRRRLAGLSGGPSHSNGRYHRAPVRLVPLSVSRHGGGALLHAQNRHSKP